MVKKFTHKRSKRFTTRHRCKVEKKVKEHRRKVNREAKKNPRNRAKHETVNIESEIPNQCPFKEHVMDELETEKKAADMARLAQRARLAELKYQVNDGKTYFGQNVKISPLEAIDNTLKLYAKAVNQTIQSSDVILEVVDARDPEGTRNKQLEESVAQANKKLIILLNKCDLVPNEVCDKWLELFRQSHQAMSFCCLNQSHVSQLLGLLKGQHSSVTIGVIGIPNTGKSSVINCLKRSEDACPVGARAGITRSVQTVSLTKSIKILDTPGIIQPDSAKDGDGVPSYSSIISGTNDPYQTQEAAAKILSACDQEVICNHFGLTPFETADECLHELAMKKCGLKKGGIADKKAAAKLILQAWTTGKLQHYVLPDGSDRHVVKSVNTSDSRRQKRKESRTNSAVANNDDDKVVSMDTTPSAPVRKGKPSFQESLQQSLAHARKVCPEGGSQQNKLIKLALKKKKKNAKRLTVAVDSVTDMLEGTKTFED